LVYKIAMPNEPYIAVRPIKLALAF
jgi:hypothetical protein